MKYLDGITATFEFNFDLVRRVGQVFFFLLSGDVYREYQENTSIPSDPTCLGRLGHAFEVCWTVGKIATDSKKDVNYWFIGDVVATTARVLRLSWLISNRVVLRDCEVLNYG